MFLLLIKRDRLLFERINNFVRSHIYKHFLTSLVLSLHYKSFVRLDKPATLRVQDRISLLILLVWNTVILLAKSISHAF
jgi:hypothetical protein